MWVTLLCVDVKGVAEGRFTDSPASSHPVFKPSAFRVKVQPYAVRTGVPFQLLKAQNRCHQAEFPHQRNTSASKSVVHNLNTISFFKVKEDTY